MRPHINNSSKSVRLSIGKGKEAGSTRIAPIPIVRACTVHAPVNMSMSKHGISVESSSSMEHPHLKERRVESQSRSHNHECRRMFSPECVHLLPPPFFHSTPVTLHHASTDSLGIRSFNMSRGSLPPDHSSLNIEMFAPPLGTITPSNINQFVSSSGPPVAMQADAALTMPGLSKEQAEKIFLLAHEAQALGRRLTLDSIQLSHQEALFRMGVQATGYEKATHGRPDRVTAYYSMLKSEGQGASAEKLNEAINRLRVEAGKAWLDTNSILFRHALEYQEKMTKFVTEWWSHQSIA